MALKKKESLFLEPMSSYLKHGQRIAGQDLELGETQGSKLQELPGRAHDHNLVGVHVQLKLEGLILLLLT